MIKNNLGDQIRRLRLQNNMTQADLAKKIDVSRPTISSWEVNRTEPSPADIQHMSEAFGCTTDTILGRSRYKLVRDQNLQRMINLWEQLSDQSQVDLIHQAEFLVWKERGAKNGNI